MATIPEFLGLKNHPDYGKAQMLLDALLRRRMPEDVLLTAIYGPEAGIIKANIRKFYDDNPDPPSGIRSFIDAATPINDKRAAIENDENFQVVQYELLHWRLPGVEMLEYMFGQYAPYVHESYRIFLESGKKRKCGISLSAHHNRVAGVVYELNRFNPGQHSYSAIAALHDMIEDMLYAVRDGQGMAYGLERYDEFIQRFIPQELRARVMQLTNHYDMIIKYADIHFEEQDKRFTKENLQEFLSGLDMKRFSTLKRYIVALQRVLDSEIKITNHSTFYSTLKWLCYTTLYIPELVQASKDDPSLFEIKLVDLSDNAHGNDALDMHSRIKNAKKQMAAVIEGRRVFSGSEIEPYLDELSDDALGYARYFILRDLLQPQLVQDFLVISTEKIVDMQNILYE